MRIRVLVFIFFALSCSSSSQKFVSRYEILKPDLHLGEYLQIADSDRWISFSRKGPGRGLVQLSLRSGEIEILDPSAAEGRELFLNSSKMVYRVDDEILLWNGKPETILTNAEHIKGFACNGEECLLAYQSRDKAEFLVKLNLQGRVLKTSRLPGKIKSLLWLDAKPAFILLETGENLALWRWDVSSDQPTNKTSIEVNIQSSFSKMRQWDSQLWIAYLNDETGVLKIANLDVTKPESNPKIETVDGEPTKTYRGMDIALFTDKEKPGLIYLDAWALRIRVARWKNDQWASEELPIKGAVGFYNQIVSESSDKIEVGTHNFRSDYPNEPSSFENLARFELQLD